MALSFVPMLITKFDPWKNKLCTCPPKYSFNPYTGCSHACIYCYISSYIPDPFNARLKENLEKRLRKELRTKKIDTYISMSNSSDPYTPEESYHQATRKCLEIFKERKIKVLIVTKSDLVARDMDIISRMNASVSMTITTLREDIARRIEPHAPSPEKRIKALKKLKEAGIPCSVRFDPIIPGVNEDGIEELVAEVSRYALHIVSSTVKPRADSLKRLRNSMPEIMKEIRFVKEGNSYYLPRPIRYELMKRVRSACDSTGITFAVCREGFNINTAETCDGSHLIPER
jgi:DNA repair photolyase